MSFLVLYTTPTLATEFHQDSIPYYKEKAVEYAQKEKADEATQYIYKYVGATADLSFLNDHVFQPIKDTPEYIELKEEYEPKFKWLSLLYFYAGFIGFYIFIVMNLKKGGDRLGSLLISLFVLFHSLFILHLSVYIINYQYSLPHTLFVSTTFSFLYGPLLYFYLKRSMTGYKFIKKDFVHLLPSLILLGYIMPFYTLSGVEKFQILFDSGNFLLPGANAIIITKIAVLSFYAYRILLIFKGSNIKIGKIKDNVKLWYRNIFTMYLIYIGAYIVYAASITEIFTASWLLHIPIIAMVTLVFYVAYMAYLRPEVFRGTFKVMDARAILKYKKSGLTPSYSEELKEKLIHLLETDKVYRENDINLEKLSNKLDTTRHNTSQIINEHFNLNFFELINKYRIDEALELLEHDRHKNLNIIDIAYQVGFNNKVTFNKSFKKHLAQTPSQYLANLTV